MAETQEVSARTDLPRGWARRWSAKYRHGTDTLTEQIRDVAVRDLASADPIIANTWHRGRRARAGTRRIHSTGLGNAHASMFERQTAMALDFHGVGALASQPFTLTYELGGRTWRHTPDYFALIDTVPTIINCRPRDLIDPKLLQDVAAVASVAFTRGWANYLVVDHAEIPFVNIDSLSASARNQDPLGYRGDLLDALDAGGPQTLLRLTTQTEVPAVARGVLKLMLWDHEVAVDLNSRIEDDSVIYLPEHLAPHRRRHLTPIRGGAT